MATYSMLMLKEESLLQQGCQTHLAPQDWSMGWMNSEELAPWARLNPWTAPPPPTLYLSLLLACQILCPHCLLQLVYHVHCGSWTGWSVTACDTVLDQLMWVLNPTFGGIHDHAPPPPPHMPERLEKYGT